MRLSLNGFFCRSHEPHDCLDQETSIPIIYEGDIWTEHWWEVDTPGCIIPVTQS